MTTHLMIWTRHNFLDLFRILRKKVFYSVLFAWTKRVLALSVVISSFQQHLIHTKSVFICFIKAEKFLRQSELKIMVICEVIVNSTCE